MTTADFQDVYPLSATQQGMLFHSLYSPESGVYVVQLNFELHGNLDQRAFDQAWQALTQRHNVLRTAFAWDNLEQPLQVVAKQARMHCQLLDISSLSDADQEQQINDFTEQDRITGFTLSRGPLMRVTGWQLSAQCHRVLCSYHHIILDGWSLPLLLAEWRQLYIEGRNGQSPISNPAPPSTGAAQYGDYIRWRQAQDLASAKAYWQQQLASVQAPTLISNNRNPKPGNAQRSVAIAGLELAQLKQFAHQHSLTLSTLVQGAWALLLRRYCDQDQVVFGLTRAGRPQTLTGHERIVGMFINTLPMVVDCGKPQSGVVEFLQQLQSQRSAQQPYEYIGLGELASQQQQPQSLFDSILVYENYPAPTASSDQDLQLAQVKVSEQTHFPLNLFVVAGDSLELRLLYNPHCFSPDLAGQLLHQVRHGLQQFIEHPTTQATQLDWQPKAEKSLLHSWNQTQGPVPRQTLYQQIQAIAQQDPMAAAVTDANQTLTYGQLVANTEAIAHKLRHQGVQAGDRVAVCLARTVQMVPAMLAVMSCNAAYVPLDPSYPWSRLEHMLNDSRCELALTDETGERALQSWSGHCLPLSAWADEFQSLNESDTCPPQFHSQTSDLRQQPAYLIYTSGSTGLPKGVSISQHNLVNFLQGMQQRLQLTRQDHCLAVTTLCFDIAYLELFLPLVQGAQLVIASDQQSRNPELLAALLQQHNISLMQATPATWRLLQQQQWSGSAQLKLLSGGEALDQSLAKFLLPRCKTLWNVYGPTETTIWSAALQVQPEHLHLPLIPIGQPLANNQLYVMNGAGQPLPPGMTGELWIGGEGVSRGYWQRPELNQQRFIEHSEFGRLYRTGDLVRQRLDGLLDFSGRLDLQVKIRGHRIELGEIEHQLQQLPGVSQAVVVVQGSNQDSKLVAFVVAGSEPSQQRRIKTWRQQLLQQLPEYMVPSVFQWLAELPTTANRKVDRKALASRALEFTLDTAPSSNQGGLPVGAISELERDLLEIWQRLLNNPSVGVNDPFFEVGGHSLLLIKAQSEIKQRLQLTIELVDLFQYPTIQQLAQYIQAQATEDNQADAEYIAPEAAAKASAEERQTRRQQLASRRQRPSAKPAVTESQ